MERRLVAILAADVVGYSRLVGEDEEGTLRTLGVCREIIDGLVAEHRGRVFGSAGDSVVAEFASPVEAVRCAADIQRGLERRNADLAEDRRMRFRIGINLGDVIVEGDDLLGDGVNVAARLEALADAGGICLSRPVFDQVKQKLELGYEYLGEQQVKNIAEPVRVYRVLLEAEASGTVIGEAKPETQPWKWAALTAAMFLVIGAVAVVAWLRPWAPDVEPASVERMAFALPDRPSIAVLPFENMSGDPGQEHLVEGITEGIITALSRIPNLFVVARTSTFAYKGKDVPVRRVAEDLGVRYVLEGSMQRTNDRIRITTQLIDALSGYHVWAQEYDRDFNDILDLQDDINQRIMTEIEVKLTEGEKARLRHRATNNAQAYVRFLRGVQLYQSFTKVGSLQALKLFEEAISLDPSFSSAYAFLGWIALKQARLGFVEDEAAARARALEYAQKALALDETDIDALSLLSEIHLDKWDHDTAIKLRKKALDLNPNHADNMAWLGWRLCFPAVNRPTDGLSLIREAMRLSPIYPNWYLSGIGLCHYIQQDYDAAIAAFDERRKRIPNSWLPYVYLAFAYAGADKMDEARAAVAKLREGNPDLTTEKFGSFMGIMYADPTGIEPILEKLREAGLPAHPPLPLPDRPSIAVLPFTNMSDDPRQEYFTDGMTEDLITDLSKISGLFVIARNSTFVYKGQAVPIKQVAEELGVRYVLEGSVRRAGDQVRINAQLIDATTGGHIWAERYDGSLADVFALQDEITQQIVTALAVELTPEEEEQAASQETDDIAAYDAFLQGWAHYNRQTGEDFAKAIGFFEKAIELDPDYARARAALALTYWMGSEFGGLSHLLEVSWRELRQRSRKYLDLAMKDPTSVTYMVASPTVLKQRRYDEAIAYAERAVALDSNNAEAHRALAYALFYANRPEEAIESANRALRLDPNNRAIPLQYIGRAHFAMGDFEQAVSFIERARDLNPKVTPHSAMLAAALAHLGRGEEAGIALEKYNDGWGYSPSVREVMYFWPFKDPVVAKRFAEGLVKAGLSPPPSGYYVLSDKERLTGNEIRALVFGRTVTGFDPWSAEQWWIERDKEGQFTWRGTAEKSWSGPRVEADSGTSSIEADLLCERWDVQDFQLCLPVFRNPEGTKEDKNEYLAIYDTGIYPWSTME